MPNLTGSNFATDDMAVSYTVNEYPLGLGSERYPHFVIFFINVNSKSKTGSVESNTHYTIGGEGHSNTLSQGVASVINGITNAANTAIASTGVTTTNIGRSYRRLKQAIALHIPHQMQVQYEAQYETVDANMLGKAILGAVDDIKNLASQGKLTSMDALQAAIMGSAPEALARGTGGGIVGLAVNGDTGALVGGITGKVDNPRAENLFKQIGFRQHQFQYTFTPKSIEESESVFKIIEKFKYHMHPEIQTNESIGDGTTLKNSFLITPDVFDIEFYYKNRENKKVNKIATCVLESMAVDYTGAGQWVAFSETEYPVCINMTLSFKEVEPLVRQMIEQGY